MRANFETFVIDMLVIGMSALLEVAVFASIASVIFLAWMALVFMAILLEICEVPSLHYGLCHQVQNIVELRFDQ